MPSSRSGGGTEGCLFWELPPLPRAAKTPAGIQELPEMLSLAFSLALVCACPCQVKAYAEDEDLLKREFGEAGLLRESERAKLDQRDPTRGFQEAHRARLPVVQGPT